MIKEVNNRKELSEGRDNGMGFAFLKKVDNGYETAHALSPCKDYLNDVVFSENTGHRLTIYGLQYSKQGIFDNQAYMAIKIVKDSEDYKYNYSNNIEVDKAHLKNNHKNIQTLINYFEDRLNLSARTIIEEANDDYFLVTLPIEWCISSFSISLFSLLLRVSMVYDGQLEVMDFLTKYNYNNSDLNLLKKSMPKLEKIIEQKELPKQGVYKEEDVVQLRWAPHNLGIITLNI